MVAAQLRVCWSPCSPAWQLLLAEAGAVGDGRIAEDTSSPLAVQRRVVMRDFGARPRRGCAVAVAMACRAAPGFPWMQSTPRLGTSIVAKRTRSSRRAGPCADKMRRALRSCKRRRRAAIVLLKVFGDDVDEAWRSITMIQ